MRTLITVKCPPLNQWAWWFRLTITFNRWVKIPIELLKNETIILSPKLRTQAYNDHNNWNCFAGRSFFPLRHKTGGMSCKMLNFWLRRQRNRLLLSVAESMAGLLQWMAHLQTICLFRSMKLNFSFISNKFFLEDWHVAFWKHNF